MIFLFRKPKKIPITENIPFEVSITTENLRAETINVSLYLNFEGKLRPYSITSKFTIGSINNKNKNLKFTPPKKFTISKDLLNDDALESMGYLTVYFNKKLEESTHLPGLQIVEQETDSHNQLGLSIVISASKFRVTFRSQKIESI